MARITVEDCLRHENNRFALVQLSSKRTRQIQGGATALVFSKNKNVVTSLREIADGVVRFKTEEDLSKERAEEEARLQAAAEATAAAEAAAAAALPQIESTNGSGELSEDSSGSDDSNDGSDSSDGGDSTDDGDSNDGGDDSSSDENPPSE